MFESLYHFLGIGPNVIAANRIAQIERAHTTFAISVARQEQSLAALRRERERTSRVLQKLVEGVTKNGRADS